MLPRLLFALWTFVLVPNAWAGDPNSKDVIALSADLDRLCRGTYPTSENHDLMCDARDKFQTIMRDLGYCFGKKGEQSEAEMYWHKCAADSLSLEPAGSMSAIVSRESMTLEQWTALHGSPTISKSAGCTWSNKPVDYLYTTGQRFRTHIVCPGAGTGLCWERGHDPRKGEPPRSTGDWNKC